MRDWREVDDRYLRRIATSYGIPVFWQDDAVQEMRVQMARYPQHIGRICAISALITFRRWLKRQPQEEELIDIFETPGPNLDARWQLSRVFECLRFLTPVERSAIALVINDCPDVKSGNQRAYLSRARRKLRRLLSA